MDARCPATPGRAAPKCIRSTSIPNRIRSPIVRETNPTRPTQRIHLGENGRLSGKSISRAISSFLRIASIELIDSREWTTARCRLMLSVQAESVPGVWVPNFNRDGNFISRNNRLSQFQMFYVPSLYDVSSVVNTQFGQYTEGLVPCRRSTVVLLPKVLDWERLGRTERAYSVFGPKSTKKHRSFRPIVLTSHQCWLSLPPVVRGGIVLVAQ
jgi:hypothetical protein